jgi:hypothetical protein
VPPPGGAWPDPPARLPASPKHDRYLSTTYSKLTAQEIANSLVVIEGVRDRREKSDRGHVIATAEEEEERGAEVETEIENGAEAETVAATDRGVALEAERGAPVDETR